MINELNNNSLNIQSLTETVEMNKKVNIVNDKKINDREIGENKNIPSTVDTVIISDEAMALSGDQNGSGPKK